MASFHILFSGEIVAGAQRDRVQANLARELGVADHKAKQLFSGRTVVIKSQLSEEQAEAYVARLADLGAVCRLKGDKPKPPNPARYKLDNAGVDRTLRDLTAAHVECPRCGNEQLLAEHCQRCGVDIAAAQKQRRKEDAIIEKKIRELRAKQQPEPSPIVSEPRKSERGWFSKRR